MTMEKFNGWMTLIGQFAVLAGLIALFVEIRGNTLSTRTQELASITDRVMPIRRKSNLMDEAAEHSSHPNLLIPVTRK